MAISYTVDESRGLVFERWVGEITSRELADHWRTITKDMSAMSCIGSLADISECAFHVTSDELTSIINSILIPAIPSKSWKVAVVVSKPVQFGVARQYGAWTDDIHQMAIFSDPELAIEWLLN